MKNLNALDFYDQAVKIMFDKIGNIQSIAFNSKISKDIRDFFKEKAIGNAVSKFFSLRIFTFRNLMPVKFRFGFIE